ncbi:MAG: redoxin domain-containing protein [Coriobacteriia bacterium]|nr:redoxin domain-containing protein [Coriobacteriia bacterium]
MRMRAAPLLIAGLALAALTIVGCTSDGGSTDVADSEEATEQNGLEVGTEAPDFRMKNQDQQTFALSDYKGTKNVVLVFYPADFTPV